MGDLILAIDQGSTSTRAVAFDRSLRPVAQASRAITASYPRPGWVEHDPDEIFNSVVTTVAEVLAEVGGSPQIAAVGLANQGETVVAWDNETGRPLGPAISWRCKRSHEIVDRLRAAGREPEVRSLTGLPLDPYFSASKLTWLLEEVPAVASASRAGRLRFGTVDAWLTWRLSGVALTDPSTASRTQLLDIHRLDWSDDLLGLFGIPRFSLPRISPSVGSLGYFRHSAWRGELPLRALVCDQQAALAGHGGFAPGALKATYGTGVFVLGNVGATLPPLSPELLATVAWAFPGEPATYALDGGVFAAAATVNWLRDGLRLVDEADQLDRLAAEVPDAGGVWVLPALAGLGAPWWSPRSRGVIAGLTDAVGRAHLARATLAGIAHGVCDVVEAMARYLPVPPGALRVDGGMTSNHYLMQRQADLLGLPLDVARNPETTALGAAGLAGVGAGLLSLADVERAAGSTKRVVPQLSDAQRAAERQAWQRFARAAIDLGAAIDPS